MSLIKPRTRGKQFVRHTTRLDRENNETLYAYARVPRRAAGVRPESADRHGAREGQGVPDVARRASGVVRAAARDASTRTQGRRHRRPHADGPRRRADGRRPRSGA